MDTRSDKDLRLLDAATEGHLRLVNALIAAGADVNAQSRDWRKYSNYTALMYAAENGHLDIVNALIGAGADPNAQNNKGKTAWKLAFEAGQKGIVDILRKLGVRR